MSGESPGHPYREPAVLVRELLEEKPQTTEQFLRDLRAIRGWRYSPAATEASPAAIERILDQLEELRDRVALDSSRLRVRFGAIAGITTSLFVSTVLAAIRLENSRYYGIAFGLLILLIRILARVHENEDAGPALRSLDDTIGELRKLLAERVKTAADHRTGVRVAAEIDQPRAATQDESPPVTATKEDSYADKKKGP